MRALEADRWKRDSNHAHSVTHTKICCVELIQMRICTLYIGTAHAVAATYKHGFAVVGDVYCCVLLWRCAVAGKQLECPKAIIGVVYLTFKDTGCSQFFRSERCMLQICLVKLV